MIWNLTKWDKVLPKKKITNLVIGFFDGLHHGHEKLFKNLVGDVSVLTFKAIPRKTDYLYPLEDRIDQLQRHFDISDIYVFDIVNQNCLATEFIEDYLIQFDLDQIIVGEDFKFGRDGLGVDYLKQFYKVKVIARDDEYATSAVKQDIMKANFSHANQWLLEPYYRTGIVMPSLQLSRKIGFPTANIAINPELIHIPDGIYISETILDGQTYWSTSFIGIAKTFAGITHKSFESYLINYNGQEFYNQEIKVIFYEKIGEVKKYPSVEALIEGIQNQVNQTIEFFSKVKK